MAISLIAADSVSDDAATIPCNSADLTVAVGDVLVVACSVNQAGSGTDPFSGFSKASGSATVGATSNIQSSFGTNTGVRVSWCRVTGAGTIRMQCDLTGSRKACGGVLQLRGASTDTDPIGNSTVANGDGTAVDSGTVVPSQAGDWFIGVGGWEANPTGSPTTTPTTWDERIDMTSTGGSPASRSSLYIETFEAVDTTAYASAPTASTSIAWRQAVLILKAPPSLALVRVRSETVQVSAAVDQVRNRTKVADETLQVSETTARLRGLARLWAETAQLVETTLHKLAGGAAQLTVRLLEAGVLRAEWTLASGQAVAESELALSTAERASITDWGALQLELVANIAPVRVTQAYMRTPRSDSGLRLVQRITEIVQASSAWISARALIRKWADVLHLSTTVAERGWMMLYPVMDVNDGTWTTSDASGNLAAMLDEEGDPNDSDYIRSAVEPVDDTALLQMQSPGGPPSAGTVSVVIRARTI